MNRREGNAIASAWPGLVLLTIYFVFVAPAVAHADEDGPTASELASVKAVEAARIAAIEKVYGAVASIYGTDRAAGGGSGVIFDPAGYALTNFHVIAGAGEEGWAGLADGKLYRWRLLGFDPGGDLAVVRLLGRNDFPAAAIGDSRRVARGDWALAMGNPFGLAEDERPTVTLGVVSAVERYQPGEGLNVLVYGNCIQIDTSINPGNSGGPLFNLAGKIIGINGRVSLEDRGRVNVGVGYAISSEQAKNFLPDLLATKPCMHGTLDAVFDDRGGKTVCNQLNVDSAIAKQGLQLGDRLIAVDGQAIRSANHLANLMSTLPAGWPTEVVYEHEGKGQSAWVRLDGLPYAQRFQPGAQAPPGRGGPGGPGDAPGEERAPLPEIERVRPAAAGTIRNRDMNRVEAERLLRRWAERMRPAAEEYFSAAGGTFNAQTIERGREGESVQERRFTWAKDGRFREDRLDEENESYGFDGSEFWWKSAENVLTRKGSDFGLAEVDHLPVTVTAALSRDEPQEAFVDLELQGSDKVAGRRAYRLRGQLKTGQIIYLWFSVFDADERGLQPDLLKVATDQEGEPADLAWLVPSTFGSQAASGQPWTLVDGIGEKPVRDLLILEERRLRNLGEDTFALPKDGA